MPTIDYNIALDMEKSDRSPEMVAARVGDLESVRVIASLTKNGAAYTPSGANAYFECITNAGTSVRVPATKSGSTVSVNIPSQALVKPGVITCAYFRFENGDSAAPTMVESTQSFGIIVPNSIDDEVIAEDYIAEWRGLAQQLEDYVAQVGQAATEAKEDIASDVSSVDSAATSAKGSISSDASGVSTAADEAIAAINKEKQDVQAAADDVTQAGNAAISQFNESSKQAIDQFNANGTTAINEFNTKGDTAVAGINTDKDEMLEQAQTDVDAKIAALEKATQDAIDAMEAALSEDQYGELLQRLARVWKLDNQDMTDIPSGTDLNTLRAPGTYVCTLDTSAKACVNRPADLTRAFYMFVLKLQQGPDIVNQLIIPWNKEAGATAVKFWMRSSSSPISWNPWMQVGSSTLVSAGKGIIVTKEGDDNEVSIDPDAFYEHVGPTDIATIDTSVTGGGRIKELKVNGLTRQNLWVNPSGTSNGITVTDNDDGSLTISGESTGTSVVVKEKIYALAPGKTYTVSIDGAISEAVTGSVIVNQRDSSGYILGSTVYFGYTGNLTKTFTTNDSLSYVEFQVYCDANRGAQLNQGTYRVMLNEGSEAQPWCPPGLNSIEGLEIWQAGKNLIGSRKYFGATVLGVTATTGSDGSVTVSGTLIGNQAVGLGNLPIGNELLPGTYRVSDGSSNNLVYVQVNASGSVAICNSNNRPVRELNEVAKNPYWFIGVMPGFSGTVTLRPQLELGSIATDYEPPSATSTPINLDGNQLCSLPDGTRDELRIDESGAVTLVKRCGIYAIDENGDWFKLSDRETVFGINSWSSDVKNDTLLQNWFLNNSLPNRQRTVDIDGKSGLVVNGKYQLYASVAGVSDVDGIKEFFQTNETFVIYPLETPREIILDAVTLPSISSQMMNVRAVATDGGGNTFTLQPEIEVDVVKTGYSGGGSSTGSGDFEPAFDILPASKGGTGVSTAAAERNRLGLGNTTGALPIANGGTGGATAKAAQYNILGDMDVADTDASDGSQFIIAYSSPTTTNGAVAKRPATRIWNWIASKIRSVFGFSASNVLPVSHGGTGATTAAAARSAIGAGTSNFSGNYNDLTNKPSIPPAVTYPISVANGGTGATTAAKARENIGAGTSNFSGSYDDLTDKPTIPAAVVYPISVAKGGTGVTTAQAERNRLGLGNTTGALPVANGGSGATSASVARTNFGIRSGRVAVPSGSAYSAFSVTVNAGVDCRNKPIFVDSAFDMADPGKALAQLAVTSRTSTGFVVSGLHGAGSGEYFCWLLIV